MLKVETRIPLLMWEENVSYSLWIWIWPVLFSLTKQSLIHSQTVQLPCIQNCSILYVIALRGIIAHQIIVGTFNTTLFASFIHKTLCKLKKGVTMDNVKFHHSRVVLSAIANNGLSVKLLPFYGPMLNPIGFQFFWNQNFLLIPKLQVI